MYANIMLVCVSTVHAMPCLQSNCYNCDLLTSLMCQCFFLAAGINLIAAMCSLDYHLCALESEEQFQVVSTSFDLFSLEVLQLKTEKLLCRWY